MEKYFKEHLPLFKSDGVIRETKGLSKTIRFFYKDFSATIEYMKLDTERDYNPYYDLYLGSTEVEYDFKVFGTYIKEEVINHIFECFKELKVYDKYKHELRHLKMDNILNKKDD